MPVCLELIEVQLWKILNQSWHIVVVYTFGFKGKSLSCQKSRITQNKRLIVYQAILNGIQNGGITAGVPELQDFSLVFLNNIFVIHPHMHGAVGPFKQSSLF